MSFANKSFSVFKRDVLLFILNVFTSIVIARKLGPELLGIWVIISFLPGYAEAFGRIKFDLAAVYFIGKKRYTENETLYHLNIVATISATFIITLIFFFDNYINQLLFNGETNSLTLIYAILPIIPLNFFFLNYSYLLISREDIKYYNIMIIIKAIIGSGGACILLLIFDLGLWSVIIASVFSVFIALIFGIWRFNKTNVNSKMIFKLNKNLLKDFFNYSYKLYISGLIGYFNNYSMKLMLTILLSPAKVAFFSLAQDRASILNKIPDAVNLLLYPRVSNSDNQESSASTIKAFRILLILSSFSSLLLAIFIYPLVLLMYGEAYISMVVPTIIILPGIIVHGTTSVFISYFNGVGRSDLTMKLSVFPFISQLILGVILINYFGIIGAAFSFTLAMFFFGFLKIFFFIKTSKISINEHIPVSSDYIYIYNFFKAKILKL
jgi:O-antigen/teichoic acid export membrane protein